MKKSNIFGILALGGVMLTGCNNFLDDNREPLSKQLNNSSYWSLDFNVQNQVNTFYNDFSGYGSASGQGTFYFKTLNDDQAGSLGSRFANWTYTTALSSSSYWNDPYTEIRRANLIIKGVSEGELNGTVEGDNFIAIARLNRGIQYFTLVKRYGDVPLVEDVLNTESPELYGPRAARKEVMNYALADVEYAVNNITKASSKSEFSQDLAKAVLVEMALFEGSYAKYHSGDNTRATEMFNKVVNTGSPLVSAYPVGDNYQALYNSFIEGLAANPEVIFMKGYTKDVFMHSLLDWTCSSSTVCGMTKDAFDSYLFADGKPLKLTSCDRSDVGVAEVEYDEEGNVVSAALSIANLLAVRDQRLAQTIDPYVMYTNMEYTRENTMAMTSHTGYGVAKYDNLEVPYAYATVANKAYTCAPLFWGARIVLAVAEAKAELGSLTDADVTTLLNPLYSRAGLPDQTLASLSNMNDPDNDMGVSSLLWEIRRCRRCEFMFDDDIRYWDLVRWHKLDLLDFTKNPDITLGANISVAPVAAPYVNGNYIDCSGGMTRTFSDREYFWPIPTDQIRLNKNLTQNPGW